MPKSGIGIGVFSGGVILLLGVFVLAISTLVLAQDHTYVGVKKCAMCHKSEKKGNQHGQWLATKHANAYKDLVDAGEQDNPKCLKCHVTAYGVDESKLGEGYKKEDGVGCESCHGAGADYKSFSVMKDRQASIQAGLILPTEKVCRKCHNKESPNFEGFDFDSYNEKITHPRP